MEHTLSVAVIHGGVYSAQTFFQASNRLLSHLIFVIQNQCYGVA